MATIRMYCAYCQKDQRHIVLQTFRKKKAQAFLITHDAQSGIKNSDAATMDPDEVDRLSAQECRCPGCGSIAVASKVKPRVRASDMARKDRY